MKSRFINIGVIKGKYNLVGVCRLMTQKMFLWMKCGLSGLRLKSHTLQSLGRGAYRAGQLSIEMSCTIKKKVSFFSWEHGYHIIIEQWIMVYQGDDAKEHARNAVIIT